MKTKLLLFLSIFSFTLVNAQTKEICVTVDDLPTVSYSFSELSFQQELTKKLIATFDKYKIPAIGFVNENKLYKSGKLDEDKVQLLRMWLEAGYELGNHSFAHKDYHKVPYDEFTADVLAGEQICKELTREYDEEYRYFRHPFLHVGRNKAKHDSLTAFLGQHDYIEAPVSIDNDDYIFAYAYSKAMSVKDTELMARIANDYLDYMEAKLVYFEGQSQKLLDRNVKHILLLHANAINADYLDELAERYVKHGYQFISMTEALKDPAYQREITAYNDWGISWIDRWALSEGKKGAFFQGDPATPQYVQDMLRR